MNRALRLALLVSKSATLGEFGVRKIDGKINIFDTYDFEERDTFHAIKDVFNETRASGVFIQLPDLWVVY